MHSPEPPEIIIFVIKMPSVISLSPKNLWKIHTTVLLVSSRSSILEQRRFQKFTDEKKITDPSEGLKGLIEHIELLLPPAPEAYQHESHNISFLKKSIIDQSWAKEPIKNINALNYNFSSFITALYDSIQADKELESAKLESDAESIENFTRNEEHLNPSMANTHFALRASDDPGSLQTLLGQFVRNPKHLKRNFNPNNWRHQNPSRASNPCRRCGGQWHRGHKCVTGNISDRARNRIRNGENHVHIISELIHEIEDSTEPLIRRERDKGKRRLHTRCRIWPGHRQQ